MEIEKPSSDLTCKVCSETFRDTLLLESHLQIKHMDVFSLALLPNGSRQEMAGNQFKRQCPLCNFLIPRCFDFFNRHLQNHHNISLSYDILEFESESQFFEWKLLIEKQTSVKFIQGKVSVSKEGKKYCKRFIQYRCNREGTKQILQHRKTKRYFPSYKTGFACSAYINFTKKENGRINVEYCSQHMGHETEAPKPILTEEQREKLADLIARGIKFPEIMKNIRTYFDGLDLKNVLKMNPLHLYNIKDWMIERAQKKQIENSVHADDLFQYYYSLPDHHISAYKPTQNPDDFCVVIMTKQQKQLLHNFGNNHLCIDSVKNLKMKLNILVVLVEDQFHNGHPVAFCVTNLQDEDVCDFFFNVVKESLPRAVQASHIFTDEDKIYANMWMNVMGFRESKLCLSHWHLEKKWKMMLEKTVSNVDKRKRVYHRLRYLITSKRAEFSTNIRSLMEEFSTDDELSVFGKYFEKYYDCAEAWAFCYRATVTKRLQSNRISFVMLALVSEVKKHLSKVSLVLGLLTIAKEAFFRQNMELHSNPTSRMICEIENDHEKSNRITDDMIARSDGIACWDVKSPDNNLTFAVSWQVYPLCKKRCSLICKHCEICPHMYYCVCPYNLIYKGICEHIHALAGRRKLKTGFDDAYTEGKASRELGNACYAADRELQNTEANSMILCQGVDHTYEGSDSNELANISSSGMEPNSDISTDVDHSMDTGEDKDVEPEVDQVIQDKLLYMLSQMKNSSMTLGDKNQFIVKLNSCISFIHSKEVARNLFGDERSTELSNGSSDMQS